MIPTDNGFIESDSVPRLSKKQMRYLDNDEKVSKEEEAIGKKIIRKKNGTADKRGKLSGEKLEQARERGRRVAAANKAKRESQKKEKEETLGAQVKKAMVEIVTKPISELKKVEIVEKPKTTQYDFSNITPFF